MSTKEQLELNPNDVNLIQKCLRREIGVISNRTYNSQGADARADLELIQSLLGKLQVQKTWNCGTAAAASA